MIGEIATTTGSMAIQLRNHETSQSRSRSLLSTADWVAAISVARPVVTADWMIP